jgi:hypothetical protein
MVVPQNLNAGPSQIAGMRRGHRPWLQSVSVSVARQPMNRQLPLARVAYVAVTLLSLMAATRESH